MNLKDCHNFNDFRKLAKKKLPSPIFHYIDGAADDEITYARNTSAFDDVDLVPNVLRGVEMLIYQQRYLEKNRFTFLSCTNSSSKTFPL
jgi:isopentenyl diphosphate isomerase/L-lactate dehydrogenase-like FMN-dependent dehydrogenase